MSENKEPQDVSEELEVVMTSVSGAVALEELTTKLEELKKKYVHKVYDKFQVGFPKGRSDALVFFGTRKENQAEINERLERDEVKRKNIDEHELKEYIRLKKKFDKKKDEG